MNEFAATILWITDLALPVLIFFVGGIPRSLCSTVIRSVLAIGYGWMFAIAYCLAAQHLSLKPINGAAYAFVGVFGWVLPTLEIFACLFVRRMIHRQKK
jgi:hypothetical protein